MLGQLLVHKMDWTPLSAYGFGCTIVIQLNNAILKISEESTDGDKDASIVGRERVLERRKQKANQSTNPKKKR